MARKRFQDGHEIRVRATSEQQRRLIALAKYHRRTASDMLRVLVDDAYERMKASEAELTPPHAY